MSTEKPYEVICRSTDADWLDNRTKGIGSSDMASVLGESPWKSAFGLWAEKTGATEPEDLSTMERIFWGNQLERSIIDGFAHRTGRPVRPAGQLLRSREYPWAMCTLDGETQIEGSKVWSPLEVKNANEFMGDSWADGAPEHYRIQAHHQMLVTGSEIITIAVLIGGQYLAWQDIDRDEVLMRRIVHAGERFWMMVLENEPPPIDGSEAAKRDFARIYPQDSGEVITLPDDLEEAAAKVMDLRSAKRDVEKELRSAENELKAAMRDATEGHLRSGTTVKLTTVERAGYYAKPSSYRKLSVKAAS